MEISKVIIPSAGIDTKFLPFSKAIPREMLPILNKPAIQFVVEESLKSLIQNIFVITSKRKNAIADHFDCSSELESRLKELDQSDLISSTEKISRNANFTYIRQTEPLGSGHAVLLAKNSIQKEHFAVALPDDLIFSKENCLTQLIRVARQEKASVLAVQEVPTECISHYGIVGIKKQITPNLFQISNIVEKPKAKDAPSSLAVVGRYILSSKIFNSLEEINRYSEEVHLSDGISNMIQQNERVFAFKVQGTRYDLGSPLGWIKAVIATSLKDPYYGPYIKKFLDELNSSESFLYNPSKIIEHNL